MSNFDFNPFGSKSIIVNFECDNCNEPVESEDIFIPSPDSSAETVGDSQIEEEGYAYCDKCNKDFYIDIYVTYAGASGVIRDFDDDNSSIYVEEYMEAIDESELYWDIQSSKQLEVYQAHISSVNKLINSGVELTSEFSFLVMCHAHIISAIELFLSSTIIHQVTNSEELIKKLIESDPEFGKRKFTLKDIFQEKEKLKVTVAIYLKELIFHDLNKVKPMYRSVFGIDFGDISWLFKAILVRHDCVHRAGYSKKEEKADISVESIRQLMVLCNELTKKIDSHLLEMDI